MFPHLPNSRKSAKSFAEEMSATLSLKSFRKTLCKDCNRSHGIRQCRNADIQYCKGCVFGRFVGNSSKRGNIIRPLIELSRGDIESYCEENNLEYVTDSTNLADDYTRNYIRHNIIPCLKKLNPSFERTALGLSENAGESAAFIKKCAEKAVHDCKSNFGYDCKKLLSLDSAVLKEMLFILLKNNCNISPERKTILLLCEIIRNGGSVELSKQCTAVSKQGILRFVCPKTPLILMKFR